MMLVRPLKCMSIRLEQWSFDLWIGMRPDRGAESAVGLLSRAYTRYI